MTAPVSYSVAGAAAATGLAPRTIRRLIADGDLPARYYGKGATRTALIPAASLAAWFQALPETKP